MAVTRYVNPHIQCYVKAVDEGDEEATPPRVESIQELRRFHNLGNYTVDQLEDLLGEIEGTIQEWVENHPPE